MATVTESKSWRNVAAILASDTQPNILIVSGGALTSDATAKFEIEIRVGSFSKTFDGTLHYYNGIVGDFHDPYIWKNAQFDAEPVVTGRVKYQGAWHDVPLSLYAGDQAEYSYLSVLATFSGQLEIGGASVATIGLQLQVFWPG